MIKHANKEQIIPLVPSRMIIHIITPSQSMTMNGTLTLIIIPRKNNGTIGRVKPRGLIPPVQIHKA
jgi:hypothetical protein